MARESSLRWRSSNSPQHLSRVLLQLLLPRRYSSAASSLNLYDRAVYSAASFLAMISSCSDGVRSTKKAE